MRALYTHIPLSLTPFQPISHMTTDYKTLLQQRSELDALIAEALGREKKDAIAQVQAIVEQYGLTRDDVFAAAKGGAASARVVGEPRFRNPETGVTWTGRGKPPKWIEGKDRSAFAI